MIKQQYVAGRYQSDRLDKLNQMKETSDGMCAGGVITLLTILVNDYKNVNIVLYYW